MAHIHSLPGQIDFTAEVFVVHGDRVLLRVHDKLGIWLSVAATSSSTRTRHRPRCGRSRRRVGLDVTIDDGHVTYRHAEEGYTELIPPVFMCRNRMSPTHEHITPHLLRPLRHDRRRPRRLDRSDGGGGSPPTSSTTRGGGCGRRSLRMRTLPLTPWELAEETAAAATVGGKSRALGDRVRPNSPRFQATTSNSRRPRLTLHSAPR